MASDVTHPAFTATKPELEPTAGDDSSSRAEKREKELGFHSSKKLHSHTKFAIHKGILLSLFQICAYTKKRFCSGRGLIPDLNRTKVVFHSRHFLALEVCTRDRQNIYK